MRFVVITSPDFLPGEAFLLNRLVDLGVDTMHLRKPGAAAADCARLIEQTSEECRRRMVVHQHFGQCRDYGLQGIHLNSRNPLPPEGFRPLTISASCHSIDEVERRKPEVDYVFLSPVFNSISKQGYMSAYTTARLEAAARAGIIDSRVVALGGVDIGKLPQLRACRFGGAAFLGYIWQRVGRADFYETVRNVSITLHQDEII